MNPFFYLRITFDEIVYVAITTKDDEIALFSLDSSGNLIPIPDGVFDAVRAEFLRVSESLPYRVVRGMRFHEHFFSVEHEGVRYGLLVPYGESQGVYCYKLDEHGSPCGDRVVGDLFKELCVTFLVARAFLIGCDDAVSIA